MKNEQNSLNEILMNTPNKLIENDEQQYLK
jgi:hypothetical protein